MRAIQRMPVYFRWLTYLNYIRFGLEATLINSYGFDRCAHTSGPQNQTDFFNSIPTEKMLEIYSSDEIDADLLVKSVDAFVNGIIDSDRSLILKLLDITDSDYGFAIAMLAIHFLFYRTLTYLIVLAKIRSRS